MAAKHRPLDVTQRPRYQRTVGPFDLPLCIYQNHHFAGKPGGVDLFAAVPHPPPESAFDPRISVLFVAKAFAGAIPLPPQARIIKA